MTWLVRGFSLVLYIVQSITINSHSVVGDSEIGRQWTTIRRTPGSLLQRCLGNCLWRWLWQRRCYSCLQESWLRVNQPFFCYIVVNLSSISQSVCIIERGLICRRLVNYYGRPCVSMAGNYIVPLLGSSTLVGCLKFYYSVFLSFFLFYRKTALSSRGEAAHQMYTRGTVIGADTIIDPQISPIPPNFYRGSKSVIFGFIADKRSSLSCCGLQTEQDIFTIPCLAMTWQCPHQLPPSLVQIGPRVF